MSAHAQGEYDAGVPRRAFARETVEGEGEIHCGQHGDEGVALAISTEQLQDSQARQNAEHHDPLDRIRRLTDRRLPARQTVGQTPQGEYEATTGDDAHPPIRGLRLVHAKQMEQGIDTHMGRQIQGLLEVDELQPGHIQAGIVPAHLAEGAVAFYGVADDGEPLDAVAQCVHPDAGEPEQGDRAGKKNPGQGRPGSSSADQRTDGLKRTSRDSNSQQGQRHEDCRQPPIVIGEQVCTPKRRRVPNSQQMQQDIQSCGQCAQKVPRPL